MSGHMDDDEMDDTMRHEREDAPEEFDDDEVPLMACDGCGVVTPVRDLTYYDWLCASCDAEKAARDSHGD